MEDALIIIDDIIGIFDAESKDDSCEFETYINKFDVECWYDIIKDITFQTEFIQLSKEDSIKIMELHEQAMNLYNIMGSDALLSWLNDQILSDFVGLRNDMDKVISNYGDVFPKLSSRSPKDSFKYYYTDIESIYKDNFNNNNNNNNNNNDSISLNDKALILFESIVTFMSCDNSIKILSLFILSKRIYEDLQFTKTHNVILRKYEKNIRKINEFRAIVYNNKLNCLSQYQHTCKSVNLIKNKDIISNKIIHFWENKCRDTLSKHYNSYVIDFVLINNNNANANDYKNYDIKVIELNPYHNTTGALLFSWKFDDKIIKNGPFQFRLQEYNLSKNELNKIEPEFRSLIL